MGSCLRLFITGATGFIGSAICRKALAQGWHVAALIRHDSANEKVFPDHPNLTPIKGSLEDLPLEPIMAFGGDWCIHCAWITKPGLYRESPANRDYELWSKSLIEALPRLGIKHFAMLGSCIEYKLIGEPMRAGVTPIEPDTPYAKAKNAVRDFLIRGSQETDLQWLWARVFYPYGDGEHRDKLCSTLIRKLTNREAVTIEQPHGIRDYLHVEDLADALLLLLRENVGGEVNLGSGLGIAVGDLADNLAHRLGGADLIHKIPSKHDPNDRLVADISHLKALGWSPSISLVDGLERLIRYNKVRTI